MCVYIYSCIYRRTHTTESKRMNAKVGGGGGGSNKLEKERNANEKEGENEIRKEKSSLNE